MEITMKPKNDAKQKLAECLHLFADIIANSTSNEALTVLEKALVIAKKELLLGRKSIPDRSQKKAKVENTAPAQESLAFQERSSSLSIKEFGRDVTSETEFPTRRDLINFAVSKGVQVTDRETKATILKRLLSKAELRNMDELVGHAKDK